MMFFQRFWKGVLNLNFFIELLSHLYSTRGSNNIPLLGTKQNFLQNS